MSFYLALVLAATATGFAQGSRKLESSGGGTDERVAARQLISWAGPGASQVAPPIQHPSARLAASSEASSVVSSYLRLRDIRPGTKIKINSSMDTRWRDRLDTYFEYEPTLGDKIAHSFTLETMHYPSCHLWYGYSASQNSTIVSRGRELTVTDVQLDRLLGNTTLIVSEDHRPVNEPIISSIQCADRWHADTDWKRARRVIRSYPITVGEFLRTFRLASGATLFGIKYRTATALEPATL